MSKDWRKRRPRQNRRASEGTAAAKPRCVERFMHLGAAPRDGLWDAISPACDGAELLHAGSADKINVLVSRTRNSSWPWRRPASRGTMRDSTITSLSLGRLVGLPVRLHGAFIVCVMAAVYFASRSPGGADNSGYGLLAGLIW